MEKDLPELQWFPGHMKRARDIVERNLNRVDVVVELLDARIPMSSANPLIKSIVKDKPRLLALNKSDLADPNQNRAWIEKFRGENLRAVEIDSVHGKGMRELIRNIEELARPATDKFSKAGAKPRSARVMIVGIPNVGKSSLINRLLGKSRAKTENRPGVTRDEQWIKIAKQVDLLDTPGILWAKFEDPEVGLKLAFTGAIRDDIYDKERVSILLLEFLSRNYPAGLIDRYKLESIENLSGFEMLELIGRKRGFLIKGGNVDLEKSVRSVLVEFRSGNLGRVTLDRIEKIEGDW
ncbi:MAG: ribosome biogenesis GTPase YlqF [Selenomonadaceae bacterium]|nr:ribosome biogenesis GTPase YlqF [Selenomonadaceae bacterium]